MSFPPHRAPPQRALLLLCLLLLCPALPSRSVRAAPAAREEAQRELILGVRHFRAEHYEEALATFRHVAATAAVPEIGFYLGTTLHKLGRHAEALTAFRLARRAGTDDPLIDYYQAVSCYRLEMLERARRGFAALLRPGVEVGPRLREGAQRFLQAAQESLAADHAGERYAALLDRIAALGPDDVERLEWLEEAALAFSQVPERARQPARLRKLLLRTGSQALPPPAQVLLRELGPVPDARP